MSSTSHDRPLPQTDKPLALLASGGLDSCVLLGELVRAAPAVVPIFVRVGSHWEDAEFEALQAFIHELNSSRVRPIVELQQPVDDLYRDHWSLTGHGVPMLGEPDEASFLPGRNVLLLAKPLLYCLMKKIPVLATAPLSSNPFPDATPEFYDGFASAVSLSMSGLVRVWRPYAELGLHKADVVRRGAGMPLGRSLSCAKPVNGLNCGLCSKCGERQDGFRDAKIPDPTRYANAVNE